MKSWHQFREDKERDEEKNGLDFDHDNEKNEPKAHQQAVKRAKEKMLDFFEKRKAGASKIASEARAKGGPSMLTAWHFAAKAQPYTEVLAAIRSNQNEPFFAQKCHSLVGRLRFGKLKQEEFQKVIGELEVWGEAIAQLFN
jgi:hypothetical protein